MLSRTPLYNSTIPHHILPLSDPRIPPLIPPIRFDTHISRYRLKAPKSSLKLRIPHLSLLMLEIDLSTDRPPLNVPR